MKHLLELLHEQETEIKKTIEEISSQIYDLKVKQIKLNKALKAVEKQKAEFQ